MTESQSTTITRPHVRVQGAKKSFSGRVVVDVENLVLGDAAIEGLIGPNGAGKTTLMRMIMHSTNLDEGRVVFHSGEQGTKEVVLSEKPTHEMAGLGVVKSNQVIMDFEQLTILDSLLLAVASAEHEQPHRVFGERELYDRHRARIGEYLDFFSFPDPTGFAQSAGEKKLLDIVRCLLLQPRFLLLDEPTAGLPDELTGRVMEAVRMLAAEGTTVVVVEHDLDVIWNISDQVHFMAEGEVILNGDPDEVRRHKTVIEKYLGAGHVEG